MRMTADRLRRDSLRLIALCDELRAEFEQHEEESDL